MNPVLRTWLRTTISVAAALLLTAASAASSPPVLIAPADGATSVDPGATMTWTSAAEATSYRVLIGSAQGIADVWDSGQIAQTIYPAMNLVSNTMYWVRIVTYTAGGSSYSDSTFTTGTGTGRLSYPANGASGINGPSILFSWSSDPSATVYYPYFGTSLGANDVFNVGETTQTHVVVNGFQPNTNYYVRMWVKRGSSWTYTDTQFITGTASLPNSPVVTSPSDNASDVNPGAVQIAWTVDPTVSSYYPYLGTDQGLNDVFNFGAQSATTSSVTAYNLAPNTTYWIRLFINRAGSWSYKDSKFTTGLRLGVVTSPIDGASGTLPAATIIAWSPDPTATWYYPYLGTAKGLNDVYNFGTQGPGVSSVLAKNLAPNTTYWVRLWVRRDNNQSYTDTQFTTGTSGIVITSPPNGGTYDVSSPLQFTPGASSYSLYLGTQPGLRDVFDTHGSTPAAFVENLIPSTTYYWTLVSNVNGAWLTSTGSFKTAGVSMSQQNYRETIDAGILAIREMTVGITNVTIAGTLLDEIRIANGAADVDCRMYAEALISYLRTRGIFIRKRFSSFIPGVETHTVSEYYDPWLQTWRVADPTFGIRYDHTLEELSALVATKSWESIRYHLVTSYEKQVASAYYIEPILLFLNPQPVGAQAAAMNNSPLPYMTDVTSTAVGTAGTYIFSQAHALTILNPSVPTTTAVQATWLPAVTCNEGWSFSSDATGVKIYRANQFLLQP